MVPRSEYLSAKPFPHCVVDGYFPDALLDAVVSEWPIFRHFKRSKDYIKNIDGWIGVSARRVIEHLQSDEFVSQLNEMTGFNLMVDPFLFGGGLHEVPVGGFLNHHIDFNWNERIGGCRRLNLLLYLNRNWTENGWLDLVGDETVSISPEFNRMVIFTTSEKSWHGHPEPLTGDRARKSIAVYYYEKCSKSDSHTTIYR